MSESTPPAGVPADNQNPPPPGPTPPPGPGMPGSVHPAAPAPGQFTAPPQEPSTNAGWIIAAMILFWPTAIPALFAALRASRALGAGNWPLAATEAARAKKFSLISIWVAVGLIVLYILAMIVFVIAVVAAGGSWEHGYYVHDCMVNGGCVRGDW